MRFHLPLLATALLVGTAVTLPAQQALRPAPSSRATAQVELTYPEGQAPAGAQPMFIRLDYGQPHLRGRALHTATLVPYDQPWRTGANASSTLTTDVDLMIGGKAVPKGTYVLWTLPTRNGWTLMLQKGAVGQMVMQYAAANDVARVELKAQTLAAPVESFTMWLVPAAPAGAPAPGAAGGAGAAQSGATPAAAAQAGAARGELRMAWGTTQLSTEWMVK